MAGRLYPPIVAYAMPAFASTSVNIYFSVSNYNSLQDIKNVQITVRHLDSNENALKVKTYPGKVKAYNSISTDPSKENRQDKYYVTLENNDLEDGFKSDHIYKIQLRFSTQPYGSGQPTSDWLNSNVDNFSEWSTVTLIRKIDAPTVEVLGLGQPNSGAEVNFTSADSVFTIVYSAGESNELLQSWKTTLCDSTGEIILANSGWKEYNSYDYLPVDKTNSISFESILPYSMAVNTGYILKLDLLTRNGYSIHQEYPFICSPIVSEPFEGEITAEINEEEGYANILVVSNITYSTNIILRRTSSKSNFTIWEDLSLKVVLHEVVHWSFQDFTIESGVFYKYGVQTRDTYGRRGALVEMTNSIMGEFDYAFLLEEDNKQLKLKYDFQISSMNVSIAESKTDTIGSQYPYIRRNGTMYYRTFQCSGLITGYMDTDAHLFTTNAEVFDNNTLRYEGNRDRVSSYVNQYDYTYERKFREKVQEFLYDGKVKLFKSLQEGNILVKLLNISLTPKNELGRLLYSFSAQAVEIDNTDLTTLQSYNIQSIVTYASSITFSKNELGQISSYYGYEVEETDNNGNVIRTYKPVYKPFEANQNIMALIGEKYGWKYVNGTVSQKTTTREGIIIKDFQLSYFRIEFESGPYLIDKTSLQPSASGDNLTLGWVINIGGTSILVSPPNNIYELNDDNFMIQSNTNISFPAETEATIYYSVALNEEYNPPEDIPISVKYNKIIGQLNKIFSNESDDEVFRLLSKKYNFTNSTGKKIYELKTFYWADIEAEPGTIFYAKSSASSAIGNTKFIMNETGNFLLEPNIADASIVLLYFAGKQLDTRSIPNFNTIHNKGNNKPSNPVTYDYYSYIENNQTKYSMYFDRKWRSAVPYSNVLWDIECPVHAIVNYEIQQQEGEYQ